MHSITPFLEGFLRPCDLNPVEVEGHRGTVDTPASASQVPSKCLANGLPGGQTEPKGGVPLAYSSDYSDGH